eukprot:GFKZ01001677.1.p1 GENE.GFKZ01001677.1~~GFKZ01001677.1.p1  ORF type:complete len:600 (+),score=118.81 GFKZ01001677.1:319-2118(+)
MTTEEVSNDQVLLDSDHVDTEDDFSKSGDLSGDGGVMKEIVSHGIQGWQKPENGDDIQMHYKGTLLDGSVFDSSYDRGTPFSFKLGEGKVIKGWDIVGKTMAKGEKAKVTLKPEYAYGASGSPPKIPPNSTLVFEMELLGWTSKRDVFGDGSVIKTEVSPGEGWERPGSLAEATLEVVASEMDRAGTTVVKQLHSGEVTFTLGSSNVPEAWEKVVEDMKKNTEVKLVCRPPHTAGPGIDYVPEGTHCVCYNLKLLSWLKIDDVHNDGTLVKKVLKEGDGWERPNEGATVVVNVKYMLPVADSKLVVPPPTPESEVLHEGFEFKIDDGVVIDGLDRVVKSMKLNESAIVAIAPTHAFKTAPGLLTEELRGKGFTADAPILVEILLTKFEKAKDVWSMSFEEKVENMKTLKQRGNDLFKAGRFSTAKKSYDRAVAFFDSPTSDLSPELKSKVNDLLVSCHLNLAVCNNKLGDIQKVMSHCKKALDIQPSNVKALYHQGCAYLTLEDFYNANSSLKYALELSPGNVDVRRKLKELREKRVKQDAADKKLYSNLFGRMSKMEAKEQKHTDTNGHTSSTPIEEPEKVVTDAEMKDSIPIETKDE